MQKRAIFWPKISLQAPQKWPNFRAGPNFLNALYKSIAAQGAFVVGLVVVLFTYLDCDNIENDFCKVCNNQGMCNNEPCASKGDIKKSGVGYQTCWSQRYFCYVIVCAFIWAIVSKVQAHREDVEKADKAEQEQRAFFEAEGKIRNSVHGGQTLDLEIE